MKYKKRTAAEFVAEMRSNPDYVQRSLENQRQSADHHARLEAAGRPVLDAIHAAGVMSVVSLFQMRDAAEKYPRVLDILVDHLQREYPEEVRWAIAQALAVPQARHFWGTLLRLFRDHPDGPVPNKTKCAIGSALAASADSSVLGDVIAIMREPNHGENRGLFLEFLAETSSPEAQAVFEEAGRDPQFAKEVKFLKRSRQRKWRKGPSKTKRR